MQKPDRLYIEKKIRDHPFTIKVLNKLNPIHIELVDNYKKIGEEKPFSVRAEEDKSALALAERKGEFLKNIGRMERDEFYLFHEIDCRYDCEYCYLQYYFQTKVPVVFVNRDELMVGMEEVLKTHPSPYFHVGEVCDSLAFDDITEFSLDAAELFSRHRNGAIEFRTKSSNVENLLSIKDPPGNMIPSWTFSPEIVTNSMEHKTPSFGERLLAAKRCQEAGYMVGVRLDPVIRYQGWEKDYQEMVGNLLSVLDTRRIDYISLGTAKLHKLLLEAIKSRFPQNPVILDEVVPSADGKYRYVKFKRVDVYRKMISWIKRVDDRLRVELSMESDEVRRLVFD